MEIMEILVDANLAILLVKSALMELQINAHNVQKTSSYRQLPVLMIVAMVNSKILQMEYVQIVTQPAKLANH